MSKKLYDPEEGIRITVPNKNQRVDSYSSSQDPQLLGLESANMERKSASERLGPEVLILPDYGTAYI